MTNIISQNAFIERLGPDFDLSRMLVVDFMHEFELGVWKGLFTHLIRILYAAAPSGRLVAELDKRYDLSVSVLPWLSLTSSWIYKLRFRRIPLFSQTIRRFTNNVSEMKKMAARDYEDLLQVSSVHTMLHVTLTAACSVPYQRSKVSLTSLTTNA